MVNDSTLFVISIMTFGLSFLVDSNLKKLWILIETVIYIIFIIFYYVFKPHF
jgi:hypothetical protein